MATISIQPKGKFWYTVISYKDENGKWKNKMQTTGLPIKGNKKRAEKVAAERLAEFKEPEQLDLTDPLLSDYLKSWLEYTKGRVERTTYNGYESTVKCVLLPYFEPRKTRLKDLTLRDVQAFYDSLATSGRGRGGNPPKPSTIRRYHAAFHKALEHAVKMELIDFLNQNDRFAAMAGVQVVEMGQGCAKAVMTVVDHHLNGAGVCQGGALFTLADLAFAAAVNSGGFMTVGISHSITFVRSAMKGDQLTALAHEDPHHKMPFCEVRVTNQRDELICVMTGTAYRRNAALMPQG